MKRQIELRLDFNYGIFDQHGYYYMILACTQLVNDRKAGVKTFLVSVYPLFTNSLFRIRRCFFLFACVKLKWLKVGFYQEMFANVIIVSILPTSGNRKSFYPPERRSTNRLTILSTCF